MYLPKYYIITSVLHKSFQLNFLSTILFYYKFSSFVNFYCYIENSACISLYDSTTILSSLSENNKSKDINMHFTPFSIFVRDYT